MGKRLGLLALLLSFTVITHCTFHNDVVLVLPAAQQNETIHCHTHYCFVFDTTHKQSKWLAYELRSNMIEGDAMRSSRFFLDTTVEGGTAKNEDYRGSGFDRGHLVPAGDMVFCDTAMRETFYYSNISPQTPAFNRGIWKRLESTVRDYAHNLEDIHVVTGPVLSEGLPSIGESSVSVPSYFYKTILVYNDTIKQGIAFLMPNARGEHQSLYRYALTIRELEEITGINFYPKLPRRVSRRVELEVDTLFWKSVE
jgi:endonuclease G